MNFNLTNVHLSHYECIFSSFRKSNVSLQTEHSTQLGFLRTLLRIDTQMYFVMITLELYLTERIMIQTVIISMPTMLMG